MVKSGWLGLVVFLSVIELASADRLLVAYEGRVGEERIREIEVAQGLGGAVGSTIGFRSYEVGDPASVRLDDLRGESGVELVEWAHSYGTSGGFEPNDPRSEEQWFLDALRMPEAWEIHRGSPDVLVAIVDTGVDVDHEELRGRVLPGASFVAGVEAGRDVNGHGTMLAGIAAASIDNGLGIAGIAPGVRLLSVTVADARGWATSESLARGIRYAADEGAHVILVGVGGFFPSGVVRGAIHHAEARGTVVVAPAGNGGGNAVAWPAAFDEVVAVGSLDRRLLPSMLGNTAFGIDVAAPGERIPATLPGDGYGMASGTSAAAAIVAGVAALIRSVEPGLPPRAVRAILSSVRSEIPLADFEVTVRYGLVHPLNALAVARGDRPTLVVVRVWQDPWVVSPGTKARFRAQVANLGGDRITFRARGAIGTERLLLPTRLRRREQYRSMLGPP